jgi:chitin synthase
VAIRGEVYDLTDFWQYQHSDISAQPVEDDDMLALAGQDITNYFPIPLTTACPNLVTNENLALSYKTFQPVVSMGIHYSGHLQPATNTALNDENWYFRSLLPAMRRYHKGPLVWSRSNITKSGSTDDELKQKTWATYNHRIYDLTDYMWTLQANPDAKLYQFLNPDIVAIFQGQSGGDITAKLDALDISDEDRQNTMQCIERLFFVGYPDPRELPRCRIQPYSLLGFSALIVLIVLVKVRATQP